MRRPRTVCVVAQVQSGRYTDGPFFHGLIFLTHRAHGTSSSQWRSQCTARRHTPLCVCVCVCVVAQVQSGRYPEVYSGRYTVGDIQWEVSRGIQSTRHEQFTMAIKVRSKAARAVHNGDQSAQQGGTLPSVCVCVCMCVCVCVCV